MTGYVLQNLDNFLQIAVLLFLIAKTTRLVKKEKAVLVSVFFLLAMISFLGSDLYWITHTLMMPDERLPFTASEIGDLGMFLLLGAVLSTAFQGKGANVCGSVIGSVLFVGASTALWIGWSGEWVKDILSGIALCYFVCRSVMSLSISGSFTKPEWAGLIIAAAVLIACQSATFFVPESMKDPLDIFCYILMFFGIACFFIRNIAAVKAGQNADVLLGLSFTMFAWTISAMYMSADPMYYAADTASTLTLLFMYNAVRKKVDAT